MMAEARGVRCREEATVRPRVGAQCRYATGGDGYVRVSDARKEGLDARRVWTTNW